MRTNSDGKVKWTASEKVIDDDFETIRKHEDQLFERRNYSTMKDPDVFNDLKFSKSFSYLWPTEIDDDVNVANRQIVKETTNRKERC